MPYHASLHDERNLQTTTTTKTTTTTTITTTTTQQQQQHNNNKTNLLMLIHLPVISALKDTFDGHDIKRKCKSFRTYAKKLTSS
jgi:hypothetical protein